MEARFEWGSAKSKSDLNKHRVSFETATCVFADPFAVVEQDRIENGGHRIKTGFSELEKTDSYKNRANCSYAQITEREGTIYNYIKKKTGTEKENKEKQGDRSQQR